MTPEQQQIAIVEACKWTARHYAHKCDGVTIFRCGACGGIGHSNCYGNGQGAISFSCSVSPCCEEAVPPDYLKDLNAMHEVEKAVFRSSNLWQKFVFEIIETSGGSGMCELDALCCLARATASQRAEAFLRTIGKWEEAK